MLNARRRLLQRRRGLANDVIVGAWVGRFHVARRGHLQLAQRLATVAATGIVAETLASLPAGMVTVAVAAAAAILLRQTERGFLRP